MTRYRLPNDFEDHESRALVEIMRKHASTFGDWGYDATSFGVELDAQAQNPWPNLMRELFEQLDAPREGSTGHDPAGRPDAGKLLNTSSPAAGQNRA